MKVRFWGVRGSIPVPGSGTLRVGGNTTCVEVTAGGEMIIIDAGSGIRALSDRLLKEGKPVRATMFFTHVHHDHVQGWPFFVPAYIPTTGLKIYGERTGELGIKENLSGVMVPPYFPVTMDGEMKAHMEFFDVGDGQTVSLTPSVSVTARRLNHPNGALGYRIESVEKGKKRVFTFVTDTEHTNEMDQNVVELAREADAFAYDSAFTPKEFESKKGWGHSTWQEGVRIAKVAKAKRFVIFHHEPTHTDRMMTEILKDARAEFKRSILAHEGLELSY